MVEAAVEAIDDMLGAMALVYVSSGRDALNEERLSVIDFLVPESASLAGHSSSSIQLLYHYGVSLLGVSPAGQRFRVDVRKILIKPGDVISVPLTESIMIFPNGKLE